MLSFRKLDCALKIFYINSNDIVLLYNVDLLQFGVCYMK